MAAEYLTVVELAAHLHVGRMTAYRLLWSGEIERINIAPKGAKRPSWRARRTAADAWMASRAKGGQTPTSRGARKVA